LHKLAIFLKFQISFTFSRYVTAVRSSNITQERYGAWFSKYVAYFIDFRADYYKTFFNFAISIFNINPDYNIAI